MKVTPNGIKIKHKINGNITLYSCCIDCSFKIFETINDEDLYYLLEEEYKGKLNERKLSKEVLHYLLKKLRHEELAYILLFLEKTK